MPASRPLTPNEVLHIRALWDTRRYSARSIAQLYGCAAETIARIGRRETWNWLSEDTRLTPPAPGINSTQPSEADLSLAKLMEELEAMPTTKEEGDTP